MGPNEVYQFCEVEDSAQSLIQTAMQQMQLSARAYHRILKVSRTIADLGGSDTIGVVHITEALQYGPTQWV
jgi:magnesium chelatase family protein